jgi:hypothetical protein
MDALLAALRTTETREQAIVLVAAWDPPVPAKPGLSAEDREIAARSRAVAAACVPVCERPRSKVSRMPLFARKGAT